MSLTLVVVVILVAAAVAVGLWLLSTRNSLIQQRNEVRRSWTDLDQMLKERRDELPRLIGVCRSYLTDRPNLLDPVLAARAADAKASEIPDKAHTSDQLSAALKSLFAEGDRRQDLGFDASYRRLKKLLSDLDDRIGQQTVRFNEKASAFNARLARLPGSLVGRFAGLRPQARFDASSKAP